MKRTIETHLYGGSELGTEQILEFPYEMSIKYIWRTREKNENTHLVLLPTGYVNQPDALFGLLHPIWYKFTQLRFLMKFVPGLFIISFGAISTKLYIIRVLCPIRLKYATYCVELTRNYIFIFLFRQFIPTFFPIFNR